MRWNNSCYLQSPRRKGWGCNQHCLQSFLRDWTNSHTVARTPPDFLFMSFLPTTLLAYPDNIAKYIYLNTDLKVCFQETQTQEATSFTWHVTWFILTSHGENAEALIFHAWKYKSYSHAFTNAGFSVRNNDSVLPFLLKIIRKPYSSLKAPAQTAACLHPGLYDRRAVWLPIW